jgi:GT2 family glycosyltransferase
VVVFTDDDCQPIPEWASLVVGGYEEGVVGVGGPVVPILTGDGYLPRYLERTHRHEPLELELTVSPALPYRFLLYLRRQWTTPAARGRRDVYCFVGCNMSFRREALLAVGGFDERYRFGSEEEDLVRRLTREPAWRGRLLFVPEAALTHHYDDPTPRSILRRSLAYGMGNALQYRKWPTVRPTIFPWPFLVATLLVASGWLPPLAIVAVLLPVALYPNGLKYAVRHATPDALLDAYVQFSQEAFENAGFLRGAWAFRDVAPEPVQTPERVA